jgi:speckle-type POZ protein
MFSNSTLESMENKVTIKDFDLETIREMLRFMYTQKVENLQKVDLELLKAANKYDLLDLKELCAKSTGNDLSVENITKILRIADMHICPALKNKAFYYSEN